MKRILSTFLAAALVLSITMTSNIIVLADFQEGDYTYSVTDGKATILDYSGSGGNVVIPDTLGGYPVTVIGDSSFTQCHVCASVTQISIPDSVTNIGVEAFRDCYQLEQIIIPNNVTTIGEQAFFGCSSMTNVTIGTKVTDIGNFVFFGCTALNNVIIPNNVTVIGDGIFSSCSSLSAVTIGSGLTTIPKNTFESCSQLTSITIPDTVTVIEDAVFYRSENLTNIIVSVNNANYSVQNGVLFNKNLTELITCPIGIIGGYSIPNTVTKIHNYAFNSCKNLTSITIPNSVTIIGNSAFSGCDQLTAINIPGSVTSIEGSAFAYCRSLTGITIPTGINKIPDYAFNSCQGLTQITIPDNITEIEAGAFYACSGLKEIVISENVAIIGNDAFSDSQQNITAAYFLGNAPVIGTGVFAFASPTFKVYYINGKTGFTNPWNGYVTEGRDTLPPKHVTGVALNKTTVKLKVAQTLQLTATVSPIDSENKAVTWKSSNTKIATVSTSGKITAKAKGYATVTVTTVDGAKIATCKVTVIVPVTKVVLNKKTLTLKKGKTYRLIATVYPTNASDKKVYWKTGSKRIATVSSKGLVRGIKKGAVYIYVYTVDGKKTAKCKVTIK
ncbi:MAG: leucine-rich repeat protein [Clostridia bacterium]